MPFKGMTKEDLQYSNQLKTHALRVMGTVDKCLARIDDTKKIQEMLHDLGSRHVMYNAKVDYIDVSILKWGLILVFLEYLTYRSAFEIKEPYYTFFHAEFLQL